MHKCNDFIYIIVHEIILMMHFTLKMICIVLLLTDRINVQYKNTSILNYTIGIGNRNISFHTNTFRRTGSREPLLKIKLVNIQLNVGQIISFC